MADHPANTNGASNHSGGGTGTTSICIDEAPSNAIFDGLGLDFMRGGHPSFFPSSNSLAVSADHSPNVSARSVSSRSPTAGSQTSFWSGPPSPQSPVPLFFPLLFPLARSRALFAPCAQLFVCALVCALCVLFVSRRFF